MKKKIPGKRSKPINDFLVRKVKLPKPVKKSVAQAKKKLPKATPDNEDKAKRSFVVRFLDKELHKHPFAVPLFTFIALSLITLISFVLLGGRNIGAHDSQVVQLSVDGERIVLPTKAQTVGTFLERADVDIKQGDVVEPSTDTRIDANDFRINVYRAKQLTIVDGDKRTSALSAATTPRAIAAQVGIRVYAEDRLTLTDPQEVLRRNLLSPEVVIERATPVNLNIYGEQVTVRTHASTVEELLAEKNVKLAAKDQVIPKAQTELSENIQVFITRIGIKIKTETQKIDNEVEYIEDSSLSFGTTAIRQAGSPGSRLVTYEVKLENGVEVSRKKIQEVITKDPVKKIIARGKAVQIPDDKIAIMRAAGLTEAEFPYAQYILDHENRTWCPTRWQGQFHCPPFYEPTHGENSGFGYGLCQSTPAIKMASAGEDWRTNAVTQMKWCDGYASGRYGTWEAAYNFWVANRWW